MRGKGLLLALDLCNGDNACWVSDKALERGLLLNTPWPDSLRFMPALNASFSQIDLRLEILAAVLFQI